MTQAMTREQQQALARARARRRAAMASGNAAERNLMPDNVTAPSYQTDGDDPFARFLERGPSPMSTGVDSFQSGMLMGFDDEVSGVGQAVKAGGGLLGMAKRAIGPGDAITPEMKAAYEREQRRAQVAKQYSQTVNPKSALAGEIAGAVATGGAAAAKGLSLMGRAAGRGVGTRIGAGVAEGAAYGAAYGAGNANQGERLEGAKYGAAVGGATGGALTGATAGIGAAYRGVRGRGKAPTAVVEAAKQRVDDAADLGVDLSQGQATKDFARETFENDALTGGRGNAAQRIMEGQRSMQREQVDAALTGIQSRLGRSTVDDPYDAAVNIQGAVKRRADDLRSRSSALYDAVGASGAQVDTGALSSLSPRIWQAMDDANGLLGDQIVDHMPAVKTQYARIAALQNRIPKGAKSIDINGIEKLRQSFSKTRGATADEGRVLGAMRREFDNWFSETMDEALLSGDPKVLDDLKQARGLYAQYLSIKKSPTQIVRKMADNSADSVEIANWLMGTSKLGGRQNSAAVVREIKGLIGDDSQAMNDLRRAAFTKLVDGARTGEMKGYDRLAGDITEFVSGKGRDLARELYGPQAQMELLKLAKVLRTLTPSDLTPNPSRSGQTVARRVWETLSYIAPFFGLAAGDLIGLLGGLAVGGAMKTSGVRTARKFVKRPVPKAYDPGDPVNPPSAVIAPSSMQAVDYLR